MSNINKQAHKMRNYLNTAVISGVKLLHLTTDELSALLDELEAAEKRIAELELRLSQQQSIAANNLDMFRRADARVSELEEREVVLPQRISMEGGAYCTAHARYDEDGDFYYRDEVIESLVAAGIITKVGE